MTDFDDIQALWKQQSVTPPEVDMNEITKKANHFSKQILLRNIAEWFACVFVGVFFISYALDGELHVVSRVGSILVAIGAALIGYRLMLDGRVKRMPDASLDTHGYIAAYRDNLNKQAQLLHDVWLWYLGPMVPGLIAFLVGVMLSDPTSWTTIVAIMIAIAASFIGIHLLNRFGAKKLRKKAEEL